MAVANANQRWVARRVEQLRTCAGDYRPFNAERVQRWLAWWETNRLALDLRGHCRGRPTPDATQA